MYSNTLRVRRRQRRKRGLRKRVRGTSDRPRLTVSRTGKHIYAQIIDDDRGVTLCSVSTRCKDLSGQIEFGGNVEAAARIGVCLAERARACKIEAVCFDRNGYRFHGRVKALADAVREGGLKF